MSLSTRRSTSVWTASESVASDLLKSFSIRSTATRTSAQTWEMVACLLSGWELAGSVAIAKGEATVVVAAFDAPDENEGQHQEWP